MHNEQLDDLRPVAVGETSGWRGPTAPRFTALATVPASSPADRPPAVRPRRDVSHMVRSRPVFIGARRPRHRVRRAIGVVTLCIAVMSLEFWVLNQIPEAKPASVRSSMPAVPPKPATATPPSTPPQPTSTSPAVVTVGTQEMAQALAVFDNPIAANVTPPAGQSQKSRSRRPELAHEKPAPRQQPVLVRAARMAAAASTTLPKPAEVPAADPAVAASFKGVLMIDSMPAGARVFVDRQLVGFTPVALPNVAAGSRVVRVEADAHEAWSSAVRIVADEETRLSVQLNRTNR